MKREGLARTSLVILLGFLVLSISLPLISALTADQEATLIRILENPIIQIVFGAPAESATNGAFADAPLGTAGVIIIHIMVWAILFVAFGDILGAFLPLQNKFVPWVIGFGLAVIVANFGFIPGIIAWAAAVTATFGAASVFVSILIAFGSFVLATFFGNKLKVMQMKKEALRAQEGAYEAAAGMYAARALAKAAKRR